MSFESKLERLVNKILFRLELKAPINLWVNFVNLKENVKTVMMKKLFCSNVGVERVHVVPLVGH